MYSLVCSRGLQSPLGRLVSKIHLSNNISFLYITVSDVLDVLSGMLEIILAVLLPVLAGTTTRKPIKTAPFGVVFICTEPGRQRRPLSGKII